VARPLVVAILGPTATGKSALGLALAAEHGGEIINCDSTAVYRGFDIGTDKVPATGRRDVPHHLIDIVEPTDDYTAAQYARDASGADARSVSGPWPRCRAAGAAGSRRTAPRTAFLASNGAARRS
jgi:tRNA dimethylallyltransferase